MKILRKLLRNLGLKVNRVVTREIALEELLAGPDSAVGGEKPNAVYIFDDEPRMLREMTSAFRKESIIYFGRNFQGDCPQPHTETFWVATSGTELGDSGLLTRAPWISAATRLIVRMSPTASRRRTSDFSRILEITRACNWQLLDVASLTQAVPYNSANNRVVLVFSKYKENPARSQAAGKRISDAHAFLPIPIATSEDFKWLTATTRSEFTGGVFNPGAAVTPKGIVLLCRGEKYAWPLQEIDETKHFISWTPLSLQLTDSLSIASTEQLAPIASYTPNAYRFEDFRLFQFGQKLFSNHSSIRPANQRFPEPKALDFDSLEMQVGFSEVDMERRELRFIGHPTLDRARRKVEKNWAVISHNSNLHLIYSVQPYVVLRCDDWQSLRFVTEIELSLDLPFTCDGGLLRNSINPVEYDDRFLLHIVHKVFPSKQYVFWPLLINRNTLRPEYCGQRPIVRASESIEASILYVSSAIVTTETVTLFAGVNDSALGSWQVARCLLDANWRRF